MFFSYSSNNSTIGIILLNKTSSEFLSELEHINWYTDTIKLMKESRKQEWLAIRVLLKNLLGQEKKIFYTKEGIPYFLDSEYQIGISHTKGYASVILHKKKKFLSISNR